MNPIENRTKKLAVLLPLMALFLAGGCASPQMKGTPFYTGEYSVRRGPVEDRVNLWPLLYYREPALSILWPVAEFTEDHYAIRPLFSVYDLEDDEPTYNVLWPLARFDTGSHDHRIFPFFWGEDYRVAFPLFWHFEEPWGDGGAQALIPLWWRYSEGGGRHSTHLVWPFFHLKDLGPEKHGWRVWPLAGHYENHASEYSFAFWPLMHFWSDTETDEQGSCVLPLYLQQSNDEGDAFFSLLYSRGHREETDKDWSFLFPFFYNETSPQSSRLISLLYGQGEDHVEDESWRYLFPLWCSKTEPDRKWIATLLGALWEDDDESGWLALPLLSGGTSGADGGSVWMLGPIAHAQWNKTSRSHHVFPLYYSNRDEESSRFLSLLWSSGKHRDGDNWQLLPPVFYRSVEQDSSLLVTPLFACGTEDGGDSEWWSIIPLFLNRETKDDHLVATLLGGYRRREDTLSWLFYPLLAGGRVSERDSSFWALMPLIHARWDEDGSTHHLLPLYFWDGWEETFLSPLYAQWRGDGGVTRMFPPMLSWMTSNRARRDLWMLGPLAHLSWGTDAGASHLFPLFYNDARSGTFISPLVSKWQDRGVQRWLYPPLLSLYAEENDQRDFYGALGLFHHRWGENTETQSHIVPLYVYEEDNYFLSLLYGKQEGPGGFMYPLTPLCGFWQGGYTGGWIFPLFSHRRNTKSGDLDGQFLLLGRYWQNQRGKGSGFIPLYTYRNSGAIPDTDTEPAVGRYGKRFWSLPFCWYKNELQVRADYRARKAGKPDAVRSTRTKKHGAFPLWHYSNVEYPERGREDVNSSLLLLLYDYKRTIRQQKEEESSDYTRARILWRLWHYERANGDVSVDVFPGITYDRKKNGFKKFSFLWRLIRYEKGPDGKKVDLLFLPLVRREK